jgi:Raf kinase inhibitor-like YbhB/YbcL family protein
MRCLPPDPRDYPKRPPASSHTSIKAFILLLIFATSCARASRSTSDDSSASQLTAADTGKGSNAMALQITSPAFSEGGSIPSKYTCEGQDISPPLAWSGAPPNAKSFALIVDDPDAPDPAKPQRVYVHWVLYNIPSSTTALPENASQSGLPKGAAQGKNDWGNAAFGGPCPPIGRHRYFHKLYALDTALTGLSSPTKTDLERAMKGHIIASGELMGTYQKSKS